MDTQPAPLLFSPGNNHCTITLDNSDPQNPIVYLEDLGFVCFSLLRPSFLSSGRQLAHLLVPPSRRSRLSQLVQRYLAQRYGSHLSPYYLIYTR